MQTRDHKARRQKRKLLKIRNESTLCRPKLEIQCERANVTKGTDGVTKLSFVGYNGGPVDLWSYGFEYPVIYNIAGIQTQNTVPMLYRHYDEVGHTTTITKTETQLSGEGALSVTKNSKTQEIADAAENGFPYQTSMGLEVNLSKLTFLSKGQMKVNGRTVEGPVYIAEESILNEMTITPRGRDNTTSIALLNQEDQMALKSRLRVLNEEAGKKVNNENPGAGAKVVEGEPGGNVTTTTTTTVNNDKPPTTPTTPTTPGNLPVSNEMKTFIERQRKYPNHIEVVQNSILNGWDDERLAREVKLYDIENSYGPAPAGHIVDRTPFKDTLVVRLSRSLGVSPEFMEKKGFDKKVVEEINNAPEMGLREILVHVANSNGGRFTGHSDVVALCDHIKRARYGMVQNSYSSIDFPSLLIRGIETRMEQRWELDAPWYKGKLLEESNNNFKPTERIRPDGGQMWEGLKDSKIPMGHGGGETKYTSQTDTIGQMLVFDRKTVINDDFNVVSQMIDWMYDGAVIQPEYQLVRLMMDSSPFWTNNVNSFTSTAFSETNLNDKYLIARKAIKINVGRVDWQNLDSSTWAIVHGVEIERTVWETIKQQKLIGPTGSRQGEANYWTGKLDMSLFANLTNTDFHPNAAAGTWFLWPKVLRYAPFSIVYLNGVKRPTSEIVDLPGDMLGFGVRGYWDVKVNRREPKCIIRCRA